MVPVVPVVPVIPVISVVMSEIFGLMGVLDLLPGPQHFLGDSPVLVIPCRLSQRPQGRLGKVPRDPSSLIASTWAGQSSWSDRVSISTFIPVAPGVPFSSPGSSDASAHAACRRTFVSESFRAARNAVSACWPPRPLRPSPCAATRRREGSGSFNWAMVRSSIEGSPRLTRDGVTDCAAAPGRWPGPVEGSDSANCLSVGRAAWAGAPACDNDHAAADRTLSRGSSSVAIMAATTRSSSGPMASSASTAHDATNGSESWIAGTMSANAGAAAGPAAPAPPAPGRGRRCWRRTAPPVPPDQVGLRPAAVAAQEEDRRLAVFGTGALEGGDPLLDRLNVVEPARRSAAGVLFDPAGGFEGREARRRVGRRQAPQRGQCIDGLGPQRPSVWTADARASPSPSSDLTSSAIGRVDGPARAKRASPRRQRREPRRPGPWPPRPGRRWRTAAASTRPADQRPQDDDRPAARVGFGRPGGINGRAAILLPRAPAPAAHRATPRGRPPLGSRPQAPPAATHSFPAMPAPCSRWRPAWPRDRPWGRVRSCTTAAAAPLPGLRLRVRLGTGQHGAGRRPNGGVGVIAGKAPQLVSGLLVQHASLPIARTKAIRAAGSGIKGMASAMGRAMPEIDPHTRATAAVATARTRASASRVAASTAAAGQSDPPGSRRRW